MNTPRYVGFAPRMSAWLVDKLLFIGITSLMAWLYPVKGLDWRALAACGLHSACYQAQTAPMVMALTRWLVPALIVVWFLTRLRATPGKLLLQAEVVDAQNGATLSARQAWIRVLACPLSYLTLGVGHLMVIVDPKKQALHDKIAGTVVIRPARHASKHR
jgi:uncharacterized RDD family membrane protein YckC